MAEPKPKPAAEPNQALRMLGLPRLPRKLPSRNWLIFWAVTGSLSAALIYDRREKRRATARWAAAVEPLAREPLPNPSAMPRRVTVYLEAPPGDGLRVAQDHFADYVKPVLASSGLDWEFVVGRREGDVRAVVAERVRRARRAVERDIGGPGGAEVAPAEEQGQTEEDAIEAIRRRNGIAEYSGVKGDIVIGRHTWKEYVRGLHEGWLGPLTPPPEPRPEQPEQPPAAPESGSESEASPKEEEAKPKPPPPQPRPYNTPEQYPSSPLPLLIPAELTPSAPLPFPHILGFLNTPTRMRRFFSRRYLADEIGREVAAVCFCTYREFRETAGEDGWEQEAVLAHEERDWIKSVWKETEEKGSSEEGEKKAEQQEPPRERIWASPMVLDSRIATRMRRFDLRPDEEERARAIVVPEEKVEGWTKGKLRSLWRWGVAQWKGPEKKVDLGDLDGSDR